MYRNILGRHSKSYVIIFFIAVSLDTRTRFFYSVVCCKFKQYRYVLVMGCSGRYVLSRLINLLMRPFCKRISLNLFL